jgi:integrase
MLRSFDNFRHFIKYSKLHKSSSFLTSTGVVLSLDGEVKDALLKLPRHITYPFVFQKNGRHYSESYARKLWNRITSEMGIKISLYQGTRHSSITAAVERIGYDDVQEFVGHANRAMTKRYGKMNVKRLERVLRPK